MSALTDPHWRNAPTERDPGYFWAWQRVSLTLQRWLRDQVAERYFEDLARFENRPAAYPVIVYQASRLCHGRPRTEFTYDLRDYPECRTTLATSWKLTGRAIQAVLGRIERRLIEAGMDELAHRYAPVWHQDVLVAVKKKPKAYVDLLMAESAVINAAIDLGTERSVEAANRFGKTIQLNLRKVCGMDLQGLGVGALEEATRVLTQDQATCSNNFSDTGSLQNGDVRSAGSPDARVGGKEDGDDRRAHGRGEMSDAGVVADVDARRRDPAGQLV
ncbi:MAG: hypothetical protein JWO19_4293 [Bryobacterales bacterium]|nr:hypothetical protein [Bryobacterales bacterium]